MIAVPIVIVGAGPTGLVLAIELGRRGVPVTVVSQNTETSTSPKATVTQARTMEHFRRLGLAARIRETGGPDGVATDIVYTTRITWHELARHRLPSPDEARRWVREDPDRWMTPELTHRSSQMWIEPILLDACRRLPSVDLQLGWQVVDLAPDADGVTIDAEDPAGARRRYRAQYLVGCDGATSTVRTRLGIGFGESSSITEFKGRPMFSVHARAPGLRDKLPFAPGWLYAAINTTQRGSCISLDGNEFKFSFWRPEHWTSDRVGKSEIAEVHYRMFGRHLEFEVIDSKCWRGGASLVADRFAIGRVFLAGDAVHLFTPSAGLGYNTGVDDAIALGWRLAAAVRGWGGDAVLATYEQERRPEAMRRTQFAAECAERLARFKPSPELDQDTPAGVAARAAATAHFAEHLPFQYDIPGINFGARCDDSAIVIDDGTPAPRSSPHIYVPSARPGGRAPHAWLPDGRALQDCFGLDFTLLCFGDDDRGFARAAAHRGIPLTIAHVPRALRDRYEADLVLVRPDTMIAWRGATADPDAVLARATGLRYS